MHRRRLTGVVLMVVLLTGAVTADTTSLNRQIATLFTEVINESTDPGTALELVNDALEFNPQSSDALLLRAYINRNAQDRTISAVADLEQALSINRFSTIDDLQAIVLLAELRARTGEWAAARSLVQDADLNRPETDPDIRARALFVLARALFELDEGAEADRVTSNARNLFPDDPRFFLLELERDDIPGFRYRRELERLFRTNGADPSYLAALLRYAVTAPTPAEQEWAAHAYLNHGGANPLISFALARSSDTDYVEVFESLGGYSRRDVYQLLLTASSDDEANRLRDAASEFSGISHDDENNDGFWEERVTVSAGFVVRWEVDRNQDGVPEIVVHLADGEPVRAIVLQNDIPVTVVYDKYPACGLVEYPNGTGATRHILVPYSLTVRVPEELPPGPLGLESAIRVSNSFRGVDLEAASRASSSIHELDSSGIAGESRSYADGALVRVSRDRNGDGSPDELVVYANGLPSRALRDIDFDGYFELAVSYVEGREAASVVDEDDNGVPDATEVNTDLGIREWDLDQDGTIDVVEFGIWTDSIVTTFPLLQAER